MSTEHEYTPPRVWQWDKSSGGKFANINRPIAGATHEKELPRGAHPLQLYSLATPNGVKITVMLEELLALGHSGAEYDAWLVDIGEGEQFGSDFVKLNPNSKIPVLLDCSVNPARPVFESCAILHYLARKFGALIPQDESGYAECLSWLFWQESSSSFLGGGFGHFYKYAPYPMEYPINRYAMETKRQLDVLDRHLADRNYMCGDEYCIADIAIWSWYGQLVLNVVYEAVEFLDAGSYKNVNRWAQEIKQRDAVTRGRCVNRSFGTDEKQLKERHSAEDIDKVLAQ
ncbi:MAG: glutathione-dependent disulfide-bond oxidoreductase [Pseudomonadota bacterium]